MGCGMEVSKVGWGLVGLVEALRDVLIGVHYG